MTVKELIEALQKYDEDLEVNYFTDYRKKISDVELKFYKKSTFPQNEEYPYIALTSSKGKTRKEYSLYEKDVMILRNLMESGVDLGVKSHTLYNIKTVKKFPLQVYDRTYEKIKKYLPDKSDDDKKREVLVKKIKKYMKLYTIKIAPLCKVLGINPKILIDIKNGRSKDSYDKLYYAYGKIRSYLVQEYSHKIENYNVEKDYYTFFTSEIMRMAYDSNSNLTQVALKLNLSSKYLCKLCDENQYCTFEKLLKTYNLVKQEYEKID